MYIGFNGGVKLSWILFQRHIPSIKLFCFERRKKLNDPTQFEQVDETCEFGGAVLYSESLGITAFFENAVPSKYETQTQTASIWHRKRKNQAVRTRMSHSAFSMEFSST